MQYWYGRRLLCVQVGGWVGGEDGFGVGVLEGCTNGVVYVGEGFGAVGIVGGSGGS